MTESSTTTSRTTAIGDETLRTAIGEEILMFAYSSIPLELSDTTKKSLESTINLILAHIEMSRLNLEYNEIKEELKKLHENN